MLVFLKFPSPFQTKVVPRRGHVITMASTNLQDIKLECEGCIVVFITLDEFLTFMTYHRVCSKKYHDGCLMWTGD